MAAKARKDDADFHKGRIVPGSQQPQQSKRENKQDEAHAKAVAVTLAARDKAEENHRALLVRIAQLDASLRRVEQAVHSSSQRNKLCCAHPRGKQGLLVTATE
jgi:hypothetical protein